MAPEVQETATFQKKEWISNSCFQNGDISASPTYGVSEIHTTCGLSTVELKGVQLLSWPRCSLRKLASRQRSWPYILFYAATAKGDLGDKCRQN